MFNKMEVEHRALSLKATEHSLYKVYENEKKLIASFCWKVSILKLEVSPKLSSFFRIKT